MDKLNAQFQNLLVSRSFILKTEKGSRWLFYKGRLTLDEELLVDFTIQVPCSDHREVVQIVFEDLAFCQAHSQKSAWLKHLNTLNREHGVYYYFCLRDNGSIFARSMIPVDPDRTDMILDVVQVGGHLVRQLRLDRLRFEGGD